MARPRAYREVSDNELRTILEEMSQRYHDGVWGVRAGEFDRLRPSDISRANRQLSRRGLAESKEGWEQLTSTLIGKKPKPLAWADQVPPVVEEKKLEEAWGNEPLSFPYWLLYTDFGMPAIEGFRVIGEWCPITHRYVPVQCEKVMLLR